MLRNVKSQKRNSIITLYCCAIIGVILSFIAYWAVNENEKMHFELEFEKKVEPIASYIQYFFKDIIADVDQVVSFFEHSSDITRAEFKSFTEGLISRKTSIQALEWVPVVRHSERKHYENLAEKDGLKGFSFIEIVDGKKVPESIRQTYFPVFYVEPYKGNRYKSQL